MSQVVVQQEVEEKTKNTIEFILENVNPFDKESIWTPKLATKWNIFAIWDTTSMKNMFDMIPVVDLIEEYYTKNNIPYHLERLAWGDRHKPGQAIMKDLKPQDHAIRIYTNDLNALKNAPFTLLQIQIKDENFCYN